MAKKQKHLKEQRHLQKQQRQLLHLLLLQLLQLHLLKHQQNKIRNTSTQSFDWVLLQL
jgi:hypothetical protein